MNRTLPKLQHACLTGRPTPHIAPDFFSPGQCNMWSMSNTHSGSPA